MALKSYKDYLTGFNNTLKSTSSESVFESVKDNLRRGHNIDFPGEYNKYAQGYYQNFDRYYSIYNSLEMDHYTQYVFLVRPDLNIVKSDSPDTLVDTISRDQFFQYMCSSHNTTLRGLTSGLASNHDFIPFLVGRTEGIQMPDVSIKNYSLSQPFTNILIPYGGNMWESLTGGTFDITFREDKSMLLHKFFQAWVYYIDGVTRNVFTPKKEYYETNTYDYMTSIYYFICQADGESLVWWNKYTGAFPTNVPNSDLSFNLRGSVETKISIPFVYFMQDIPLNPAILIDFNRNSSGFNQHKNPTTYDTNYISGYDPEVFGTRNGLFGPPFISNLKAYPHASIPKLRWRAPKVF